MHVGIDCKTLQDGPAGMRTYLRNLLDALVDIPGIRLSCFICAAFKDPDLPAGVGIRRVAGPWINNFVWIEWQLLRAARRMAAPGKQAEAKRPGAATADPAPSGIQVFHFPAYTACSRMPIRKVVSVHDVSYAAHPHWYPHSSGRFRQAFYRRSATGADAIITASHFSKSEIVRVYSVSPERVFPIHLASGLEGVQPADLWDQGGRTRRYLLHVGDLHARRNLLTALDAFQAVAAEQDLEFVLIGEDLGARAEIERHAAMQGCAQRLHFLQNVPLAQMPHWYRNASALVYPSVYEGFGLPLLEAMQWGCPVVASRAASIPEITGDAAWMVDPLNSREIAAGIRAILQQPHLRAMLVSKGIERARSFSWRRTAEQTVAVYRHVVE
ncbi:MAG: glycosyltransferase family 4 protein [Acidobacteria bacterium]|nr:glycosyltransferase family 4 protein [Acidobacteriota bacterium]